MSETDYPAPASSLDRLTLESDLRARSSVARFGMLHSSGRDEQARLFPAPQVTPAECRHIGTGRDTQALLLGGWVTVCTACGHSIL